VPRRPACLPAWRRLTAFGGVSWFQPWSKHPPTVAQQLAYSRPDGSSSGGGEAAAAAAVVGGDAVAAPEARVLVVEPLPLLQLSLQPAAGMAEGQHGPDGLGLLHPASGGGSGTAAGEPATPTAAAAAGPRSLRLLQGQVYSAQLTITNRSKAPVGWASVSIR
jgi:hypothetical protein